MRIQRKRGEVFEVDWAGKTLPIYDNVTDETVPSYLFVGVLSCSGYIYAEFCRDKDPGSTAKVLVHMNMRGDS